MMEATDNLAMLTAQQQDHNNNLSQNNNSNSNNNSNNNVINSANASTSNSSLSYVDVKIEEGTPMALALQANRHLEVTKFTKGK